MNDTIVAISTALGEGAISIIRLSGDEAIEIANRVFKGPNLNNIASHTISYGHIVDGKEDLDEVLVSVFKAPRTFTKEDVVEINCHGGVFVTNKILELLLYKGARLAEPGEFTKRAFLNGRIDLTQAEAVMDIIESQSISSLKLANMGLLGETKKLVEDFRNRVLTCISHIEVNIDYPEYEDELQITNEILTPIVQNLLVDLKHVLAKAEVSQILKSGIKTAIIGKPNVGKSSLLNALLREERAIVTNIAGTTRDIVEGSINIGGIVLNLIDTAGIRNTDDVVEKIGVEKTKKVLQDASLIILMFDYNTPLDDNDKKIIELTKDKKRIIVINKSDLEKSINLNDFAEYLLISTFNKEDINKIETKIKDIYHLGDLNKIDATYIGNARQIAKLRIAETYLQEALSGINYGYPIDIVNIDLHNAWTTLGEILGEVSNEDLLNELFSKFCLGK